MKNLKFCLLTSFYNVEQYIDDCINSVINQTYKNWIWIVSDDGSTDNTKQKLLNYCHSNPNIIYYNQSYKAELVKDINKFVPVECDYFMIMDSDDKILIHCLDVYNKILNDHEKDNIVFASCEASWIFNNQRCYPSLLYMNTIIDSIEEKTNKGCNIWGNLRAIKNIKNFKFLGLDVIDQQNFYEYLDDYVFFIQTQIHGNCLNIKRNLYDFTRRLGSVSSMNKIKEDRHKLTYECVKNFIAENKFIGRSVKTWEKDLFDDSNSLLMSGFNFNQNSKTINLFTNSNLDYKNLFSLYYDKDLKINDLNNDFEYYIVNACFYTLDELIKIFSFVKTKKTLELCIYFNTNYTNFTEEELSSIMHTYLNPSFFWSSHACFRYYIFSNL